MQKGNENWKWGVVVLLLTVFLITANQAYQHIANQEDFAPPEEDYRDSWDLEHQSGPGAGQPMQFTPNQSSQDTNTMQNESSAIDENSVSEPLVIDDDIDWDQSDN